MKFWDRCRLGLAIGASVVLVCGCAAAGTDSLRPLDALRQAQDVLRQAQDVLRQAQDDRGRHEVGGGPAHWDLLYVSNANHTVTVYRYWQQLLYVTLKGFKDPRGECTDSKYNVFITDAGAQKIVEYAHGSSSVEATLADSGYGPVTCSSDPTSGKLAVANFQTAKGSAGNIAIYANASGKPTFYSPNLSGHGPLTCGYDDAGNLLVATEYAEGSYEYALFAILYKGATSFTKLSLAKIQESSYQNVTNVQWDGKYWAIADNGNIVRYTLAKGESPAYRGTTTLSGNGDEPGELWIQNFNGDDNQQGTQVVGAEQGAVLYWHYPAGGNAIYSIAYDVVTPYGVAVSLAPAK